MTCSQISGVSNLDMCENQSIHGEPKYKPSKPNSTADAVPVLQDPLFQDMIIRIHVLEEVLEIL